MELTARNTDLQSLANLLKDQEAHKVDAIVKATNIRATDTGQIEIFGTEPLMTDDGVTDMNGVYDLSDTALRHFAERFGIDTRYARKLAERRPDILAANINGWIGGYVGAEGDPIFEHTAAEPDRRSFTTRTFQFEGGQANLFRGLLSDKFSIIDNLDVINAVFEGVRAAGFSRDDLEISGCDLTENRMRVRVLVPAAVVHAPALFEGYRNPFQGRDVRVGGRGGWTIEHAREVAEREGQGYAPGTEPIMWAGFEFGNGELGDGATYVVPRAEAKICRNGLVLPLDAARRAHIGERLETGVINWSGETRARQLALITSKVADAVRTFASVEFWEGKVAEIEAKASKPVTDADGTIKAVAKGLSLTEAEATSVLDMFIHGGQMTAGGVLNAVTAAAQTVADADRAADIERAALKALALV
jgi:hypothetical protein